jgi:hypothetical protein
MESSVRQRVKDRGSDAQKISSLGHSHEIPRHKSTWRAVLSLLIVSQVHSYLHKIHYKFYASQNQFCLSGLTFQNVPVSNPTLEQRQGTNMVYIF